MIRQIIPTGFCLKCSGCCRFSQKSSPWVPHLLKEEAKLKTKVKIVAHPGQGNFLCAALDPGKNRCRIYPRRPFECRLYPFLLNRRGRKTFLSLDLNCPFAQANWQNPEFKAHIRRLVGFFNRPDWLEKIRNNPQLIQDYQKAEDLIELIL